MTKTIRLLQFGLSALLLVSCSKGISRRKSADAERAKIDETLRNIGDSSRCGGIEGHRVEVDLNQDGRPDMARVIIVNGDAEITVCREVDLNFDGVIDLVEVFDNTGARVRDEVDLGFDGRIDVITHFASGMIVKQELDTSGDGMADRVRYFEDGVPVRVEGDTNGDGRVDYWEYYESGRMMRVGIDTVGDGRADQWLRDDKAIRAAEARVEQDTPESNESMAAEEE